MFLPYELAWDGGLHVRRFEISGTTRQRVPFEHIEMATLLAEALGVEHGLQPEPVSAEAVEAAYLRRMKAKEVTIGPATVKELPPAISGRPVAGYKVDDITATMLLGGEDFAYVTGAEGSDQVVLLRCDDPRGVILALPVKRGRPRRGSPLMTTPLVELDLGDPAWRRALCAWGCWLVKMAL